MGREIIVNEGFGNRCSICGHFFDADGVCSNKHQAGLVYERKQGQVVQITGVEAEQIWRKFKEEKKAREKALAEESQRRSLDDLCPLCGIR